MKFNFYIIIVLWFSNCGMLAYCVKLKRVVPIFNIYMEDDSSNNNNNKYDFIQQIEKDKQKENMYIKQNQLNQSEINKMFIQISSMQSALDNEINHIIQTTNDIYNRFEQEIKPLINNTTPYSVVNII